MTDREAVEMLRKADETGDRQMVLGVIGLIRSNVELVPGGLPPETKAECQRLREKHQFTMDELVLGKSSTGV